MNNEYCDEEGEDGNEEENEHFYQNDNDFDYY